MLTTSMNRKFNHSYNIVYDYVTIICNTRKVYYFSCSSNVLYYLMLSVLLELNMSSLSLDTKMEGLITKLLICVWHFSGMNFSCSQSTKLLSHVAGNKNWSWHRLIVPCIYICNTISILKHLLRRSLILVAVPSR